MREIWQLLLDLCGDGYSFQYGGDRRNPGSDAAKTASIPAVHADRLRASEQTGTVAAKMAIQGGPKLDQLITKESVENALRVLLSVSGSTNAIIHLTAIAGRAGVEVDLKRFNELSDETPVLVDLKPVGTGYMEDFHAAGGLDGVLRGLAPHLNLQTLDVTGQSLEQRFQEVSSRQAIRA